MRKSRRHRGIVCYGKGQTNEVVARGEEEMELRGRLEYRNNPPNSTDHTTSSPIPALNLALLYTSLGGLPSTFGHHEYRQRLRSTRFSLCQEARTHRG